MIIPLYSGTCQAAHEVVSSVGFHSTEESGMNAHTVRDLKHKICPEILRELCLAFSSPSVDKGAST